MGDAEEKMDLLELANAYVGYRNVCLAHNFHIKEGSKWSTKDVYKKYGIVSSEEIQRFEAVKKIGGEKKDGEVVEWEELKVKSKELRTALKSTATNSRSIWNGEIGNGGELSREELEGLPVEELWTIQKMKECYPEDFKKAELKKPRKEMGSSSDIRREEGDGKKNDMEMMLQMMKLQMEKEEKVRREEKEERLRKEEKEKEERLRKEEKEEKRRQEDREERRLEREERMRKEEKLDKLTRDMMERMCGNKGNTKQRIDEERFQEHGRNDEQLNEMFQEDGRNQEQFNEEQNSLRGNPNHDNENLREGDNSSITGNSQENLNMEQNEEFLNVPNDCIPVQKLKKETREAVKEPILFEGDRKKWTQFKFSFEMYLAKLTATTKRMQLFLLRQSLTGTESEILNAKIESISEEGIDIRKYWNQMETRFGRRQAIHDRSPQKYLDAFAWDGRRTTFETFVTETESRCRRWSPGIDSKRLTASFIKEHVPHELITKITARDNAIHRISPWTNSDLLLDEVQEIFDDFENTGLDIPWASTWPYYYSRRDNTTVDPIKKPPAKSQNAGNYSNQFGMFGNDARMNHKMVNGGEFNNQYRGAENNGNFGAYNSASANNFIAKSNILPDNRGNYNHYNSAAGNNYDPRNNYLAGPANRNFRGNYGSFGQTGNYGQYSNPSDWNQNSNNQINGNGNSNYNWRGNYGQNGQNSEMAKSQNTNSNLQPANNATNGAISSNPANQNSNTNTTTALAIPDNSATLNATGTKSSNGASVNYIGHSHGERNNIRSIDRDQKKPDDGMNDILTMEVEIAGIKKRALIDTGSSITAISEQTTEEVIQNNDIQKNDETMTVTIANQNSWKLTGRLSKLKIKCGNTVADCEPWTFKMENCSFDAIIGMPMIRKLGFKISMDNEIICSSRNSSEEKSLRGKQKKKKRKNKSVEQGKCYLIMGKIGKTGEQDGHGKLRDHDNYCGIRSLIDRKNYSLPKNSREIGKTKTDGGLRYNFDSGLEIGDETTPNDILRRRAIESNQAFDTDGDYSMTIRDMTKSRSNILDRQIEQMDFEIIQSDTVTLRAIDFNEISDGDYWMKKETIRRDYSMEIRDKAKSQFDVRDSGDFDGYDGSDGELKRLHVQNRHDGALSPGKVRLGVLPKIAQSCFVTSEFQYDVRQETKTEEVI